MNLQGLLINILNYTGLSLPVNIAPPVISGTLEVGQVLHVSSGTWIGLTPFTYTYQWYRDGVAIDGETDADYTTQAEDDQASISATVRATNSVGYTEASAAPVIIAAIHRVSMSLMATVGRRT